MNGNQSSKAPVGIWQDSVECWRRLPNKGLFFALLAAWLAVFQFFGNSLLGYIHTPSLFAGLYASYNNPNPSSDDGQGNFVPFLVVSLFWWKRKELLALPLQLWWGGLLILAAGMVLHVLGYALQQPRLSVVALFTGIYGLMGLAWGREWLRKCAFPFFLFVFCIPLGGTAAVITFPLRLLVTWLVAVTAHGVGIDVIRVGTQLYDASGTYQYEVAAACSGIRSLIAIFLLATIYGFMTFRSPWKRLLLMASAFPLAVLGNLSRMLFIIVAAEMGGQEWGNYVHESSIISLIPYIPAIVGLLVLGRLMEKWWGAGEPAEEGHP
ncbi:MAG: exosortase/archaeosortase family protein [Verrucomicrobiia bacterium]